MANVYVRSGAAGAGTGANWANAFTTLAAALTAGAAGDSFFVSEDHAETQATAMTLTCPGTAGSPIFIYCVNHAGSVPPVSADLRTTATISTTANSNITISGTHYCYGIIFSAGSGAVAANMNLCGSSGSNQLYSACAMRLGGTVGGFLNLTVASGSSYLVWDNTTVQFASASAKISMQSGHFKWRNTASAITGATIPNTLFVLDSIRGGTVTVEGVDLSAIPSGNTIVAGTDDSINYFFKDCKLASGVTISGTPVSPSAMLTDLFRCDSGGTNYRTERYRYEGTQSIETTIVRTGGASDGTTPISWKIVTTANSKWILPFEAIPIAIWNDTVGSSVTLTLYGIWGGGAVPNNDDIWMDVEYLGASGNPQGSFISASKADNLATGSALTTDTSTWGGSTTKFKMSVTFTPQQKGAVYVYVKAAKVSSTFYIDPKPVLT